MSFLSLISFLTLSLVTLTSGQAPPASSSSVATPSAASPSGSSPAASSSTPAPASSAAPAPPPPPPPSPTTGLTPLSSRKVDPNNIPYQVVGANAGPRGPQAGYNMCNSTTEGPNSLCQTLWIDDASNFCMWSSPKQNDQIGISEAYEVAWCTKPGRGTRLIPPNTFTGLQVLYAKNYIQIAGYVNQANMNLQSTDPGGELDPHGDDEQGNPLGGIVFTNGFGDNADKFASRITGSQNNTAQFTQVVEWVQFIGNNLFCMKFCNPDDPNAPQLCNHIYDEIGCTYNAVADYSKMNGTFEVCDSDDMTPPGVFTTAPGQTTTWVQPFTGNPQPPYTPNPISSSNCHTFQSTQLFAAAPTGSSGAQTSGPSNGGNGGPAPTGGSAGDNGSSNGSGGSGSNNGNGATGFGVAGSLIVMVCMLLGATITIVS